MRLFKFTENFSRQLPSTANSPIGYIDKFHDGVIYGWAYVPTSSSEPASLTVRIDGVEVSSLVANEYRDDVRQAGYGDGYSGFSCAVPDQYRDGSKHKVGIAFQQSGTPLRNSPRTFTFDNLWPNITGQIEGREGVTLYGSVRNLDDSKSPVQLKLFENGHLLTSVHVDRANSDGALQFTIQLPDTVCDGLPHVFQIGTQHIIDSFATIPPFYSTPNSVLKNNLDNILLPQLDRFAGWTYAALYERLKQSRLTSTNSKTDAETHVLHDLLSGNIDLKDNPNICVPVDAPTNPDASILIPAHNEFAYTLRCIASILLMPSHASFEIIILDDASSDATKSLETYFPGIRIIRNSFAQGFLRNCNYGARYATGNFLVFLNNDTQVSPYWLDWLLYPFSTFSAVGLVGGKLVYPDGRLQEAGGLVWSDGSVWNFGRGANPCDPLYNYVREVDYCSGACIAVRSSIWTDLGGFDDAFAPAYFEDTDLAFRVRRHGYRSLYQPKCEVIHFEGVSSGQDVSAGVKQHQKLNQPKFLQRWRHAFSSNGMPHPDLKRSKDRGYFGAALFLDHECPQPDRNAGHYAAVQEARLVQALGYRVTFLPRNLAYLGKYTDLLGQYGIETQFHPFAPSIQAFLEQRGKEFDVVYITRYDVAEKTLDLIRENCPNAKVVFNNADLHFLRQLREGLYHNCRLKIDGAINTRDRELGVMRDTDATLSYNTVEHAVILSHNLDSTKVFTCPWVADTAKDVPSFSDRVGISFLGGFGHEPNIDAVEWFVSNVVPLLEQYDETMRFHIYGSNAPDRVKQLEGGRVVIEGFVNDISQVFDGHRLFVAPLQTGAGLKGKVVDALAHGVPSVLSDIAAEGTGLRDGEECLMATSPSEWAEQIARLYYDQEAWEHIQSQALGFVQKKYSFANGRKLMAYAFRGVNLAEFPPGLYTNRARLSVHPVDDQRYLDFLRESHSSFPSSEEPELNTPEAI